MSGPLRGQIPGPSREAGTQADGAVGPGRGADEESSCGERLNTVSSWNKERHREGVCAEGWG